MKISEEFPSKYLKATDLQGREVRVTMANCQKEKLGEDSKLVLYFQGKEKGIVLNKTNATTIGDFYGDESADWFGQDVILFSVRTEYQGKPTDGLRVRIPTARDNKPAPKQANGHVEKHEAPRRDPISSGISSKPMAAAEMDDEIPF